MGFTKSDGLDVENDEKVRENVTCQYIFMYNAEKIVILAYVKT